MRQRRGGRGDGTRVPLSTVLIVAAVVVAVLLGLGWWQSERLLARFCRPLIDTAHTGGGPQTAHGSATTGGPPAAAPLTEADRTARVAAARESWAQMIGTDPVWPDDLVSPRQCQQVENDLLALCRELDAREYVKERLAGGGSCALLRGVGETLAERPPVLESELKSLAAMLANVFHLSRTLQPKTVVLLRDVMAEERDLEEAAAMTLFRWAVSRERCAKNGSAVKLEPLYEYAGFLTRTMGGQAYLRRRQPSTEALATFYALLVLDAAVEGDFNPHGIDVRPDIERCRQMIENQPLVFGDRYLAALDDMQRRWDRRTSM